MAKFIIRLDDACPEMNGDKWLEVERILDKYGVTPIVGVIPDNQDPEFKNIPKEDFWERVKMWQKKNWTIAQHGFQHKIVSHNTKGYFQLAVEQTTEFAGKTLEEQRELLHRGYVILKSHDIVPTCFFAPCHTFDNNTVKAIAESGYFKFVSDGYALHAYKKKDVLFLPNMFDTPHKLAGIQTFVYHPNNMNKSDMENMEEFIKNNNKNIVNADMYIDSLGNQVRSQGILGRMMELSIYLLRKMRKK